MQRVDKVLTQIAEEREQHEDCLRIAQAIHDYDPNLKLVYLDPGRVAGLGEAPYLVMQKKKNGIWEKLLDVWCLDQRVLDRIKAIDTFNVDIQKEIDRANSRAREQEKKAEQEIRENQKDLVKGIIRSPKDNYTAPVDGDIVTFSSLPRENNRKKRA